MGQHFLRDERILEKIAGAGNLDPEDLVLEIGPGEGTLTRKLLAYGCQIIAVEKDDELYELLKSRFEQEIKSHKLVLVHDDILNFKTRDSQLETRSYKLIANIPYNITGAILEKFLATDSQPEKMVLLVQKEVAQRIVAKEGKESILSISVKVYGDTRIAGIVKAGSFHPRPKVDSAIIVIDNISKSFFSGFSEKGFFSLLRAGFKSKRKKLSSNLASMFEKGKITRIFIELGIDDNVRAEDLKIDIWQKLAQKLFQRRQVDKSQPNCLV